ncbi:hypothetical protein GMORB2_1567 [Geosmithia morbida]|uniref:Protein CSN12 homolog n=1 Tax=Geosmithia morbida TaxID=1094350 RepID=A0A9P5CZL8_9HYPO|nr:uncharacterized protein GMORB2_1567 [Geosmithia morbida]KAF4121728.1 hypothetical protein GMORB2_1567 [Geosmithia morbida]
MNELFDDFAKAYSSKNGYLLAQTLTPVPISGQPHRLTRVWQSTNSHSVSGDIEHFIRINTTRKHGIDVNELEAWVEIYTAYWTALGEILAGETGQSSWTKVYEAWRELTSKTIRGYGKAGFEVWTLPILYMIGKYLRLFAIKSDEERKRSSVAATSNSMLIQDDFDPEADQQAQLRDCEQHLKRLFTLCFTDRNPPIEISRQWGTYYFVNLLFKTYFKLNSASLSRTILTSLSQQTSLPHLRAFPKSQRVTFRYYEGVLFFLEEDYVQAEDRLTEAWQLCAHDAKNNLERILTYLIPCRLLTSHKLPSEKLLEPFPRLKELFSPLTECIRRGDLKSFDSALQKGEDVFVQRRIYLTLERGRDIALRNLLRKVFAIGGFVEKKNPSDPDVRRTRIPVAEFQAAISMASGGQVIDSDEVECLLANMIYKGLMKGYISREHGMVVLSKTGAFPGTGL